MDKKLLGIFLLVGGIVAVIFGILYMNSPQYKAMSVLNSLTRSPSDPTGGVAIVIGAIFSIIGAGLLVSSGSSNNERKATKPSWETRRLFAEGERKIRNKDYDGAIQTFEMVLSIQPFDPTTHYYLATLYSAKKKKEEAFSCLTQAVKQGFKDFAALNSSRRLDFLRSQPEFREYVRNGYELPTVQFTSDDVISKLEKFGKLKSEGLITEEEFAEQKRKLLAT